MSGYRERGQGINVSQFLANLNTYPSAEEQVDTFDPNDLALFTNTRFFDFDIANPSASEDNNANSQTFDEGAKPESAASSVLDGADINFLGDYGNFDYSQALSGIADIDQPPASNPPVSIMPLVPQDSTAYSPTNVTSPTSANYNATSSASRNYAITGKRNSVVMDGSPESLEEASRLAAEEDKRRRNTAASARFRIKKKQREQALERTAKEMTEKVSELKSRINQLEMENKWLKNLITEKNGKSGSGFDIAEIFNAKFSAAAAAAAASVASSKNKASHTAVTQPPATASPERIPSPIKSEPITRLSKRARLTSDE